MRDYLSRTAERATATNNVIRPVLPSLFDSEKNTQDSVTVSPTVSAERAIAPGSDEPQPQIVPAVSQLHKRVASVLALAPAAIAETATDKKETRTRETKPRQASLESKQPGEASSAVMENQEAIAEFSPTVRGNMDRPGNFREISHQSSPKRPAEPHGNVVRSDVLHDVSHESSAKRATEPFRSKAIKPTKSHSQTPVTVIAAPRRRRLNVRDETMKRLGSVDRGPSAKPAIQVTIGRLEVRAVQAPSAPPKPAQKSQRMSLEEYLHSGKARSR